MIKRILPIILCSICSIATFGQTPQNITIQQGPPNPNQVESLACVDQFAGTINLNNFNGQSNQFNMNGTTYLCIGDQFDVTHLGDQDLTGDPQPATDPGIVYAFYDCAPTTTGPDLTSIQGDACLNNTDPIIIGGTVINQTNGVWVTSGTIDGNATFDNSGVLQEGYNGGDPIEFFFAPLTVDDFATNGYELDNGMGNPGPCTNVNTSQTFRVVFLNEIEISNLAINGCDGSFNVTGGLSEFDAIDTYTISIVNNANGAVVGTVNTNNVGHGDLVQFDVPEAGNYTITVEDGKSCAGTAQADMSGCAAAPVTFILPTITATPGDIVCMPVTVQNFVDVFSFQYTIDYDETVLAYDGVQNINPLLTGLTPAGFNDTGAEVITLWNDFSLMGVDIPDNQIAYVICFEVIGALGDNGAVDITGNPAPLEVTNSGGPTTVSVVNGAIIISDNAITVDYMVSPATCQGVADGTFTATAADATAPYALSWQNIQGGPILGPGNIAMDGGNFTATGLDVGSYSVTVSDSEVPANIVIDTVMITGDTLEVFIIPGIADCAGGTGDLSATAVLNGIVQPSSDYTFLWSNNGMTQTITDVPVGSYQVTITSVATGCTATNDAPLPQPAAINITPNFTEPSCTGIMDGSVGVSVSGGTPDANGNYTIFWPTITGSPTFTNFQSNLNGVDDGLYTVIVTDGNGCQDSINIQVDPLQEMTVNTLVTDLDCANECEGVINAMAATSGAAGNTFTFTWFGAVPNAPVSTPTMSTINQLCAGNYSVSVSDDQIGCNLLVPVIVAEPDTLELSLFSLTPESCAVGGDGAATLAVEGGTFPFDFTWNDVTLMDSIEINLSAGNYAATVTDANLCTDTISFSIATPTPPLVVEFMNDTLDCIGNIDGELTIIAMAGGAPITNYDWSNGDSGANQTTINGLDADSYFVTITAADGCETIDTAVVLTPEALVVTDTTLMSPLCPGLGNGSIGLTIEGGTAPYNVDWAGPNGLMFSGINASTLGGSNVVAGTYTVTITDDNNCTPLVLTITLEDPPAITGNIIAQDSVSCANAQGVPCDGSATIDGLYSDGSMGLFNYTWSSGEMDMNVNSSTANSLCEGIQFAILSDGSCFDTVFVDIQAPEVLSGMSENIDVSCFGDTDGEMIITPSGGTSPYMYLWDDMTTVTANNDMLSPGIYQATITDDKGCTHIIQGEVGEPLELNAMVNVAASQLATTCNEGEDAVISVFATGGNPVAPGNDYTYIWENNIAPDNASEASGLGAGVYSVTIIDPKGCEADIAVPISEPDPIDFILGDIEPILCFGEQTSITVVSATGGSSFNYTFSVDNAADNQLGLPTAIFAGEHLIEVFDSLGCSNETLIEVDQPNELIIEYPEMIEVELGDSVLLDYTALLNDFPLNYDTTIWSPLTALNFYENGIDSILFPTVVPLSDQNYTVTIFDENGCTAQAEIFIDVDANRNVFIPNVFTPNFDGRNDTFRAFTGRGVSNIPLFNIYDRWGELVYSATDVVPDGNLGTEGWDGTFRGKESPSAVYTYIIEVEFIDGRTLLYRGDVTLIR